QRLSPPSAVRLFCDGRPAAAPYPPGPPVQHGHGAPTIRHCRRTPAAAPAGVGAGKNGESDPWLAFLNTAIIARRLHPTRLKSGKGAAPCQDEKFSTASRNTSTHSALPRASTFA